MLAAPAMAGENKFVFVPRADSPGNDYLRVENSSLEECERRCDAQIECNAFTYNQLDSVCFLKRSANRVTTFYVFAITGIRLSPSVRPTASDSGSGISFVILSQVDSPGNDYSRIDDFSFEDCLRGCEADGRCNAFTYNHARGVCFLKRAANQWTTFFAWGTTGIKLASLPPKDETATTAPVQPRVTSPSEQAQAPQPPTPAQLRVATPSEQAQAPQPPTAFTEPKDLTAKGKSLVTDNCSRCHAIGKEGDSPHAEAPAFRTLSNKYPVENLAESLAEGIVSGHPDMPIFVFSPQDVEAIIDYLQSVQPSPQP
jgi:mono/diheme cytochrome c family protein